PFDQRRLAGAYGAHHPYVNAAARTRADVVKEVELLHALSPLGLARRGPPSATSDIPGPGGLQPRRKSGARFGAARRRSGIGERIRPEGPAVYPGVTSTARAGAPARRSGFPCR